jgi:hypothetical protein
MSFRNRQNSEPLASFSGLFRSEYKWILHLTIMHVYCVYPAMSKKSENLSDLSKKDRNKRHSSPFINVVEGFFFVVRVTLVPVSYLSAPSAVHSYRVPGTFIPRNNACFCPFCLNLTSFPTFLTLQDKHNIRTLCLNVKFICTRCETGLKSSMKARYSACF